MPDATITFRATTQPEDHTAIADIVGSTGYFNEEEVAVAVELIDERLAKGPASGYFFVFADLAGRAVGYSCYGPIAGTRESYDLYWIAVHEKHRRAGLGRRLLAETEQRIAAEGGGRIYVETSSRDQYLPTRMFYERNGYHREAELPDFYAPGDGKVIYLKTVASA